MQASNYLHTYYWKDLSMSQRALALVSLITLLGTTLWVVLMLAGGVPPAAFDAALARVSSPGVLFYLTYLNAALLVTIPATILMALLYTYCKPCLPDWAGRMAVIFVPVYCTLNLFAYLSQVTLVPLLADLHAQPQYSAAAEVLLRLTIQDLPGSVVGFFNGLAYAILGIPSIIFGIGLARRPGAALRVGGTLLALNGAACILGVAGFLAKIPALGFGTVAGGGLFFLALFPLTWAFFRE
jgi:hypothetical protein